MTGREPPLHPRVGCRVWGATPTAAVGVQRHFSAQPNTKANYQFRDDLFAIKVMTPRNTLATIASTILLFLLVAGCGAPAAKKVESPAAAEELRQEYQQMSQREMGQSS